MLYPPRIYVPGYDIKPLSMPSNPPTDEELVNALVHKQAVMDVYKQDSDAISAAAILALEDYVEDMKKARTAPRIVQKPDIIAELRNLVQDLLAQVRENQQELRDCVGALKYDIDGLAEDVNCTRNDLHERCFALEDGIDRVANHLPESCTKRRRCHQEYQDDGSDESRYEIHTI